MNRLNLQHIDQQDNEENSDRDDHRSRMSHFGTRSDHGNKKASIRHNESYNNKSYFKKPSLEFATDFAAAPSSKRKILYRVKKKNYSPEQIELFRGGIVNNSKRSTKKCLHFFTSISMIFLIFTMVAVLTWRIYSQWTNSYEINLASVSIQDPSINNYVSNVTVIRYFMYDNSSKEIAYINGEAAIRGATAYTDISSVCANQNGYIDVESALETIKDGTDSGFKLAYDLIFLIVMLCCMGYIIRRTWTPLMIYKIPLFIRSNNVSPWSYKQRFKLCAFAIFLLLSSLFTRYNMYDYSEKCLYCFDGYSCLSVDNINHGSQVLGLSILLPFLVLLLLQNFNEKLKYTVVPLILINSLFMFVVIILAVYSYVLYFYYGAYIILRVLHALNILLSAFMFAMIYTVDKYFSSEFDYYEET